MHLVDWLVERQAELGLSDREFADYLQISRSLWSLLKGGQRKPSPFVRSQAFDAFGEDRCREIRALDWDGPRQVA